MISLQVLSLITQAATHCAAFAAEAVHLPRLGGDA